MNARLLLRLYRTTALRPRHPLAGLTFGGTRGGIEAVPPPVYCVRDLGGHAIDPRTVYHAVIR
jgi:hypothetical protein